MLELVGVSAGYGKAQVLRGVDLTVPSGAISVLIGPNGAGKSTVLKAAFGIVGIWDGIIKVDGEPVIPSPLANLKRGVVYVPQGRCNFPLLTVQENLEMAAYIRSDNDGVRSDISGLLARFPVLDSNRRRPAGYLSGGQQQILETAMALMLRPRLLLIDEPSIGLSPGMVKQVLGELRSIRADGCTVLMVEQNVRAALEVASQVHVLELGRVRLSGDPTTVMGNPEVKHIYLGAGTLSD